jgi:hypothetical protein
MEQIFGMQTEEEMAKFYNLHWIEWLDRITYSKVLGQIAEGVRTSIPKSGLMLYHTDDFSLGRLGYRA